MMSYDYSDPYLKTSLHLSRCGFFYLSLPVLVDLVLTKYLHVYDCFWYVLASNSGFICVITAVDSLKVDSGEKYQISFSKRDFSF